MTQTHATTDLAPGGAPVALTVDTSVRNQTGARINVFTIVTPDLDASVSFYTLMLDYAVAARGLIPTTTPAIGGAIVAGRRHVILQHDRSDQGQLRLIEAPANAAPNRPWPGARPWDVGFGAIECFAADIEESYQRLTRAGFATLSPPTYYYYRDMRRLNGSTMYPKSLDTLTYVPIGPAGEPVYISVVLPDNFGIKLDHLHSACHNCFIVNPSRKPLWDFYGAVFGLAPIAEYQATLPAQRAINRLLGEALDSELWAGGMGDAFGMEYMEWMPPAEITAQTFPQSLDRTGHAMLTISVNDLDAVIVRLKRAGLAPVAQAALPLVGRERPEGFILRGASGELIEVIGRAAL
jgi:catechol 2,3-dioxygenase-like lactoylglutathione lyase family enzyme